MKPFTLRKPNDVKQALSGKRSGEQFIAGGTNLVDLMKKHITEPEALLDVSAALSNTIQTTAGGIRIGAMARNSHVAGHADIQAHFPLLSKAILAGASPQIRNMASTAGNLLQRTRCPYFYDITLPCNKRKPGSGCGALQGENRMQAIAGYSEQCVAVHPSDMCVALAALDATVVITDAAHKTSTIPFAQFHRLPGTTPDKDNNLPAHALITAVDIPNNAFYKNYAYLKVRDRTSYAFALVSVAAALQLNGSRIIAARLASGGVAHKPWRWQEAEAYLQGKEANAATFSEAAAIAVRSTKPLSQNGFKVPMLQGAIATALQNCLTA
ncbi:xanthine dehydrogenase YagS FAD-binding subunit [Filimonas lacunae]|uniref:Xanthine dehydrogenase YagS FAD-binding subunit n=1 Tax=Filimonas lacunae TaxID=477680 RepID=A0A173MHR6_9BACT|nr:xanthine dehydrogenase family protein subunit M [Filimonas lacunae]BAV07030.1 periplasmic aromatic aldehyde oxidoreductase, FAD binding subunit YagS [Filimonas lacunae]SIS96055.1 xanthine dehydrogenase YagS FAD-binding subunit [Filimonas lacunae]